MADVDGLTRVNLLTQVYMFDPSLVKVDKFPVILTCWTGYNCPNLDPGTKCDLNWSNSEAYLGDSPNAKTVLSNKYTRNIQRLAKRYVNLTKHDPGWGG